MQWSGRGCVVGGVVVDGVVVGGDVVPVVGGEVVGVGVDDGVSAGGLGADTGPEPDGAGAGDAEGLGATDFFGAWNRLGAKPLPTDADGAGGGAPRSTGNGGGGGGMVPIVVVVGTSDVGVERLTLVPPPSAFVRVAMTAAKPSKTRSPTTNAGTSSRRRFFHGRGKFGGGKELGGDDCSWGGGGDARVSELRSPRSPKAAWRGPPNPASSNARSAAAAVAAGAHGDTSRSEIGSGSASGVTSGGGEELEYVCSSAAIAASSCASSMSPKLGSSGIREMLPPLALSAGRITVVGLRLAGPELADHDRFKLPGRRRFGSEPD